MSTNLKIKPSVMNQMSKIMNNFIQTSVPFVVQLL